MNSTKSPRLVLVDLLASLSDKDLAPHSTPYLSLVSRSADLYKRMCVEYPDALIWRHENGYFTLTVPSGDESLFCVSFPNSVRES